MLNTQKGGEDPGRNGVEFAMRVPAPNSSDRAESGSGEMPENGRSRRKRVPKMCDCCGPNGKPHVPGHEQVSKKRGRKKKEMVSQEEVAAEEVVSTSGVVTLEADAVDAGSVSEMEEAPSPRGNPDFSQTEGASESTVMVNGLENSVHSDCTYPSDTNELSSSETLNDSMKKPSDSSLISAEPDLSAHNDAMETEPPSLCANVNKASWDHHYCKPLAGENRSDSTEGTGHASVLPPVEFTTEGIIECIHGSVWLISKTPEDMVLFFVAKHDFFFFFSEFLEQFYGKYGSFTPLSDTDVLDHLNKIFQSDLKDRQVQSLINLFFSHIDNVNTYFWHFPQIGYKIKSNICDLQ